MLQIVLLLCTLAIITLALDEPRVSSLFVKEMASQKETINLSTPTLSIEEEEAEVLMYTIVKAAGLLRIGMGILADVFRVAGDTVAQVVGVFFKSLGGVVNYAALAVHELADHLSRPRGPDEEMPRFYHYWLRSCAGGLRQTSHFVQGLGDAIVLTGFTAEAISSSLGSDLEVPFRIGEVASRSLQVSTRYLLQQPHRSGIATGRISEGGSSSALTPALTPAPGGNDDNKKNNNHHHHHHHKYNNTRGGSDAGSDGNDRWTQTTAKDEDVVDQLNTSAIDADADWQTAAPPLSGSPGPESQLLAEEEETGFPDSDLDQLPPSVLAQQSLASLASDGLRLLTALSHSAVHIARRAALVLGTTVPEMSRRAHRLAASDWVAARLRLLCTPERHKPKHLSRMPGADVHVPRLTWNVLTCLVVVALTAALLCGSGDRSPESPAQFSEDSATQDGEKESIIIALHLVHHGSGLLH